MEYSINKVARMQAEQLSDHIEQIVAVSGFVYKIRVMSGFSFIILRTRRHLVQFIHDPTVAKFAIDEIEENMCVEIVGKVISDDRSRLGVEVVAENITVYSSATELPPVVITKNGVSAKLDALLDYRPVTLRNEKERSIFKIEEGLCRGFRQYLYRNGFTEIHSPKLVSGNAEGGANVFPVKYFARDAFLAQSPQFYKQMMVGVFERVFEIGSVFRAEKHNTSRHLNEYVSVDFEMGFISGYEDIMREEEKMLIETLEFLQEEYSYELALWNIEIPNASGIPVVKFMDAKKMIETEYNRTITDYGDFDPEEERLLSGIIKKKTGSDFVFVTHYSSSKRPFYTMEDEHDPGYTLSFDLIFRGLEITTGGQRIHSYNEQIAKMETRGMDIEPFASYLMAHKYGLPPHGGLGLGLERFTARLLGFTNIRHTSLFPRDLNRIEP